MFESMLSWEGYFPHFYWHAGEEPERVGMRHHYVTPYGPYMAGDGVYVNFAVATPEDWKIFCHQVIERPDLFSDPRFTTTELRRKNRVVMEETIEKIFLEKDHHEWLPSARCFLIPKSLHVE
jgi:crotonobetainyl-CoA:carnitine CoA-transferase CaiB-like acyl-CoA transferase